MSIRRKSTAHDLATLRLHPDGSRVQQSSVNARLRTASSTVVDPRGNWIAKDAGGKSSVKVRRNVSAHAHADDVERELIDLSGDEDGAHNQSKGKQRASDSRSPEDARTRHRLSFMHDLSFLDPLPVSVSSFDQDPDTSSSREDISFPDPPSDLLKSIHHFASCHYRERDQLFDSSRNYRDKKKERYKGSLHIVAANTLGHEGADSETEDPKTEDETTEEDEDENEIADVEDNGRKGTELKADAHEKDMYKAFDGSALMAIGIVLQEYVAHTLLSGSGGSEEPPRSPKRRRTVESSP